MVYTLRFFFSSKCRLFHNSNVFGSCIIHILYIYSTNISTEYFKHGLYSPFFSLQNADCFIILAYLVPVLFIFYIQGVLKLKKNNSGATRLRTSRSRYILVFPSALLRFFPSRPHREGSIALTLTQLHGQHRLSVAYCRLLTAQRCIVRACSGVRNVLSYVTFTWPCIVINSYNKTN